MFRKLLCFAIIVVFVIGIGWLLIDFLPEKIASEIYRTEYEEEVKRYCELYSVEPALVYSVIKVESNFDPGAHSEVDAIGLMQIIEDSFDWVAWRLDREDLVFEDMYTPEYSIMFGTYMLGYLYDRYGSVELTAAAYHSGMTTVDGWIERGEVDPENVSLEDIQGSNTAHYVKKILRAYENYSNRDDL